MVDKVIKQQSGILKVFHGSGLYLNHAIHLPMISAVFILRWNLRATSKFIWSLI